MKGADLLYPGYVNPLLGEKDRRPPGHVAVVGAGTIGPDIGYYLKTSLPGSRLTLIDLDEAALSAAFQRYETYARKGVERGKLSAQAAEEVLGGVVLSTDYDQLASADLVIEAASEDVAIKQRIFQMVEERVSPSALVTSNTSSIPAATIFAEMRHPGRSTVTHFFSPAWHNPSVELVVWDGCERETIDYLAWLFCSTGKTPVVVADVVAFILSRVFDNWCNEAAHLLPQATARQIDRVAEEFVAAGPFFVLNLAHGNPIIVEANTRQMEAEGEAYAPASIFSSVDRWLTGRPGEPAGGIMSADVEAAVRDRLLGALFSQCLDSVVQGWGTAADVDLTSCLALGFKKGPFTLMADLGLDETARILRRLERERPGLPSGALVDEIPAVLDFKRHVLVDRLRASSDDARTEGATDAQTAPGDVIVLTIRRPAQLNALTDDLTDELLACILEHEDDPAIAGFVLVGYGPKAFCAGADLGRFPDLLGDAGACEQYARDCSRLLVHLDQMTKPVVAAVNGLALGGGAEIALRCHDRVALPNAVFQFPEVALGLLPGIGGMILPYRRWPESAPVFHRMLCEAESLDAAGALAIGVVSALADGYDELVRLAAERVRRMAGSLPLVYRAPGDLQGPPDLLRPRYQGAPLSREVVDLISQAIKEGLQTEEFPAALEVGYRAFGRVATTGAAAEGVAAFLGRRKPDFSRL